MDIDNIFTILMYFWFFRLAAGAGYGIYLLSKEGDVDEWRDMLLVGPAFWIGWVIGISIRGIVKWIKQRRFQ